MPATRDIHGARLNPALLFLVLAAALVFPPLLFIGAILWLAVLVAGPPAAAPAVIAPPFGEAPLLSPRSPPRAA